MAHVNKTPAVIICKLAREDMVEIWEYVAAHTTDEKATDFLGKIKEKMVLLSGMSGIGSMRDELSDGLRSYTFGKHLIFYREIDDGIVIVRVLHGARDLPAMSFQLDDEEN